MHSTSLDCGYACSSSKTTSVRLPTPLRGDDIALKGIEEFDAGPRSAGHSA